MRRIHRSQIAADDLLAIWLHIARDDELAADRLLDRIEKVCHSLAERPELGRSREELAPNLRSFPVGPLIIFFRVEKERIAIARVLHGARDLDLLF